MWLKAIIKQQALQMAKQLNSDGPVAIFSDLLSAVCYIKNEHSASRGKILQEKYKGKQELNCDTKLIWISQSRRNIFWINPTSQRYYIRNRLNNSVTTACNVLVHDKLIEMDEHNRTVPQEDTITESEDHSGDSPTQRQDRTVKDEKSKESPNEAGDDTSNQQAVSDNDNDRSNAPTIGRTTTPQQMLTMLAQLFQQFLKRTSKPLLRQMLNTGKPQWTQR